MDHARVVAWMMSFSLFVCGIALGAPADPGSEGTEAALRQLVAVGKNKGGSAADFRFKLGETLEIIAEGDMAKRIIAEFSKSAEQRALVLYLDGVRMSGLPSRPLDIVGDNKVRFGFDLIREADTDTNRRAWDTLLRNRGDFDMAVHASVSAGDRAPFSVHAPQPIKLYVAEPWLIYVVTAAGVLLLVLIYALLVNKTRMLLDGKTGFYSLGKSQMAFWGLLVLLSFVGVWVLTGTMERIPPQALVLLGISGATGLTAIFIGTDPQEKIDEKMRQANAKLVVLSREEKLLKGRIDSKDPDFTIADHARLLSIQSETRTLTEQLRSLVPNGFWYDIVNDGNGPSFHRAQVVGWTIVLGTVFIHAVMRMMSMPEFSDSLLILMGISNATYLGFKIPEKIGNQ